MTSQVNCSLKNHLSDDMVKRIAKYEKDYDFIDFDTTVRALLETSLDRELY